MTSSGQVLKVAVIGAGPSGLYSIDHLLSNRECKVQVDIFDRMPTPWGLVRYGVAPDHPEKKRIIDRRFDAIINHPSVRFFGNVEIGKDVPHEQLSDAYHAVIYAIGSADDRRLGIPGEHMPGCWGAREFVGWYNGHPDFSHLGFDLSSEKATVIGNGNVAIDIARILLMDRDELARTDIADHTLEALKTNRVKEVTVLGRRGCLQASLHSQMLAEAAALPGVSVQFDNDEDYIPPTDNAFGQLDWANQQKLQVMHRAKNTANSAANKKIVFRFFGSPLEVTGSEKVEGLNIAKTHLEPDNNGKMIAVTSNQVSTLETGLIFRSIGYQGKPITGLPFLNSEGIIPSEKGRVVDNGRVVNGVYVTGWIKRGPSGVIGSNRKCATQTVANLLDDSQRHHLSADVSAFDSLHDTLTQQESPVASLADWHKIDRQERFEGQLQNRPRVKITDKEALLAQAGH